MKFSSFVNRIIYVVIMVIAMLVMIGCTPNVETLQSKGDVDGLIEALDYGNRTEHSSIRSQAAKALGEIGDPRAVEALIEALNGNSNVVVQSAAWALGEIGDPIAVEALIPLLGVDSFYKEIREAAVEAIIKIGEPSTELLIKALEVDRIAEQALLVLEEMSWQPEKKVEHIWYWIRTGNHEIADNLGGEAIESLIAALNSEDSKVRTFVVMAMGNIGDTKVVDALIIALFDEDLYVRTQSANALGKIGDPQAVDALIVALGDYEKFVRENAAEALGKIGDVKAIEPLIDSLNRGNQSAANALGKIGALQAVEPLITALQSTDEFMRAHAAEALGALGDTRAVEPLLTALSETKNRARKKEIATALGKIDAPQLIERLIPMLSDQDLSEYAALALGEIGDAAIEPVINALDDTDPQVRESAVLALGEIGGSQARQILADMVSDSSCEFPFTAADALIRAHNGDASILVRYLNNRNTVWVYTVLIDYGQEGTEDALIAALNRFDDKTMATAFLNCGNEKLEEGARKWAKENGYIILPSMGGSGSSRWGSGK